MFVLNPIVLFMCHSFGTQTGTSVASTVAIITVAVMPISVFGQVHSLNTARAAASHDD